MHTLRPLLTLLLLSLTACAPTLRNGGDDDDDATSAGDDDDATGGDDVCCTGSGNAATWEGCDNREAIECVCDSDNWCCGSGWDEGCSDLYVSPCGATCE
ncbi:MAG: hypothetical protein GY898_09955 [Proteobacteria bacterium]|nr:hypothetical protein [Pseudomonadota bacterium]